MNKIHSFAKVVLTAIGIFFTIRIIPQILTVFAIWKMDSSVESLWIIILWPIIFILCIGVLLYVFLYKREWLAKWIVGTDELPEPDSQIQWLPAAFRLVSIATGMYCLFTVSWQIIFTITQYIMYQPKAVGEGYKVMFTARLLKIEEIIGLLIMLAIGIYLVSGAPHFVRWQVKKTLEQCKHRTVTK